MSNDKQATEEKEAEVSKLQSMPHAQAQEEQLIEFWKAYERRQCELLQEAGVALGKVLRGENA